MKTETPLPESYLLIIFRIIALAVLATVIGVVVSILALGFIESVSWLNDKFLVSPKSRIQYESGSAVYISTILLVPTIGGLVVGLLIRYLIKVRRPLGPPDTILMVQTQDEGPSLRDGILSTFAAILSLGAGASVGQYGPMVYLGTIVGSVINKLKLDIHNIRSISIASGAAAAIAFAFNAPIAGLVFSHEVILRHYSIQAFAPTTVAASMGFVMANVVFDRPPLFLVDFEGVKYTYEFALFGVLGILSAFMAILYAKGILTCGKYAAKLPVPQQFRPMIAGLVLGLVALQIPDVLGVGAETLRFATIEGAFETSEIAIIMIAKMAVTMLCLGFGFAGGVFSPALLIGILFGALFGGILDAIPFIEHSSVTPYAICGMMAVTSPVIGAPLATILIVFELTRNYDLTVAAMVSVVFSNLIAYRFFGRSIFDIQVRNRGLDLTYGRASAIGAYKKIESFIHQEFLKFELTDRVDRAISQLTEKNFDEGVVIDANGHFVGMVWLKDCTGQPSSTLVEDVVHRDALKFSSSTSLQKAVEEFLNVPDHFAPVVADNGKTLLGVVTEGELLDEYLATIEQLRREENESL